MKKEFSRVLLKNQYDEILILKDRPVHMEFPWRKTRTWRISAGMCDS